MTPIESLIRLLAESAQHLGMGQHSYIVGGAPRDFLMGLPVKDVDVVVEPVDGKSAPTLAALVARRLGVECHPDQYGVVHLGPVQSDVAPHGVSLRGQKVEIVTSRREKYDRSRVKESHKPSEVQVGTIMQDLLRRDFTINTLMWRLEDLHQGPEMAPVIDLLERGIKDLALKVLVTPLDPHETFSDDPTRMLRAVSFCARFDGFWIDSPTCQAITERSAELLRLPYEAVDGVFIQKILAMEPARVSTAMKWLDHLGLLRHTIALIPPARMRRAVQERIKRPDLLIELAVWGLDVGISVTSEQLTRLNQYKGSLTPQDFEALYLRFLKPCETEAFIQATGAKGPAIGRAVAHAKNLVLKGYSPERIQQAIVEQHQNP